MGDLQGIVQYEIKDYGCVKVKLAELLAERGITRNRLRTLTGVKYEVIDRYYKGSNVIMADLDFLAKTRGTPNSLATKAAMPMPDASMVITLVTVLWP